MNMVDLVFTLVIPSVTVILAMVLIIIWAMMPKTAKFMLKKRLMLLSNKTLALVAYDDRFMQMEALDVAPEGMLETKKKKNSMGKSFYLAKPQTNSDNTDQNMINSSRDLDVLPAYNIEGIPVFFCHIAKAVATNPKVLTALHLANRLDKNEGKIFKAKAVLPKPIMVDMINDEGEKVQVPQNLLDVDVRLPFDPVDITKNFPNYWQQSNIDSTKRRWDLIGQEKTKRDQSSQFKTILIMAITGMVICGLIVFGGKLFG